MQGLLSYGYFSTHASQATPTLGAYIINSTEPFLFNQNNGVDKTPPSPVVGMTFNNVTDPSGFTSFTGVTEVTVKTKGDYLITWGFSSLVSGARVEIAVNGIRIPDTLLDSGSGTQLTSSFALISLNANDKISLVNTGVNGEIQLRAGDTTGPTTAYLVLELLNAT